MDIRKIVAVCLLFICLGICGYLIYLLNFENRFEAREITNEIVNSMKIESVDTTTLSNTITYEFIVGNETTRYRISLEIKEAVPFHTIAEKEIFILDIYGHIVATNWLSKGMWKSDENKLLVFLDK